jgi:putative holliday junction resolvase
MNILCIDYGTKRIGVAVATTPIAEPLGIIPNSKNPRISDVITDQALASIEKLLSEFSIEKILVGISEGTMAEKTRDFIVKLKEKTQLPIEEVDETLTSVEAGRRMREKKRITHREDKDHLAATVMLQDYLDLSGAEI